MITHLTHEEIDKTKWNLCLDQAVNTMVYGYAWYLDVVAPGWEALVLGDYEAVFPLTHGRRFFISYLYQPFFTQQLGVFYRNQAGRDMIAKFIRAIPQGYRFIDISLNEGNAIDEKGIRLQKRKNFLLDLERPYAKLVKGFSDHAKRNVKKGKKNNLQIRAADASAVIDFYIANKGEQTRNVGRKDYDRLKKLTSVLAEKNLLFSLGVYNAGDTLVGCGLYVSSRARITYLLGTASPAGRTLRASYVLMDHVISRFSEHPVLLDFEGSEDPGIARFYKGFGAEKVTYFRLRINRLPLPLRWLKR